MECARSCSVKAADYDTVLVYALELTCVSEAHAHALARYGWRHSVLVWFSAYRADNILVEGVIIVREVVLQVVDHREMEQFVFLADNLCLKNKAAAVCRIEVAKRCRNRIGHDVAYVDISVAAYLVFNLAIVFVSVKLVLPREGYPYGLVYAMSFF